MSINIARGESDGVIERFIESLRAYEADHPKARIDLYRHDPDFAGQTKVDRSKEVWKYLNRLPDEVQSDLSALILLAPEETKTSFANLEFEDPVPAGL